MDQSQKIDKTDAKPRVSISKGTKQAKDKATTSKTKVTRPAEKTPVKLLKLKRASPAKKKPDVKVPKAKKVSSKETKSVKTSTKAAKKPSADDKAKTKKSQEKLRKKSKAKSVATESSTSQKSKKTTSKSDEQQVSLAIPTKNPGEDMHTPPRSSALRNTMLSQTHSPSSPKVPRAMQSSRSKWVRVVVPDEDGQ